MNRLLALLLLLPSLCLAQSGLDDASMVFDGANDRIEVNSLGNDFTGFTDFTFLGKFKTTGAVWDTQRQLIFSAVDDGSVGGQAYNHTNLWIGTREGKILFSYGVGTKIKVTFGGGFDDNEWHNLAVSLTNQDSLMVVVDGTVLNTIPDVNIDFDLFGLYDIGHEWDSQPPSGATDFFTGNLDDLQIWNAALDLETINFLQCTPPLGSEPNLVAYWPMDTMAGDVVPDASDNAHDGTLFGDSGLADPAPDSCDSVDIQPGCMDPAACNFHPEANVENGSCTYLPDPIELGADIYTCDSTVQLEAEGGFDAYLWSNGEMTPSIEVTEIGDYAVEATLGSANQRAVQLHAPTILESSTDPLINGIFAGLHPFSVSLWVKADQLSGVELCDKGYSNSASGPNASSMQLFSGADGLSIQLFTDASHWMGLSTSPATGLLEGEWNHVVCTYNGGTTSDALRLYVNGADLDTISTPIQQGTFSGLHANAEPLHFGGRTSASGVNAHPLDGLLDDIFVFDHALAALQVEQLLTCGICWTPTCHWDFEETDAATGDLISGTFASSGDCNSSLYSPSFPGNALLSPSAEVRSIHPQCLFTDSISVTLVPCTDLPSLCGEGTMWSTELHQCVEISEACTPSCGTGTVWDPVNEECIVAIPTDTDFDGCVTAGDVLNLLATFGTCPPLPFSGPCQGLDHVTYHGYNYDIVAIGEQCWFAENLQTQTYTNGEEILDAQPSEVWMTANDEAQGAFCFYDDGTTTLPAAGALYNGHATDDPGGLCPTGWRVPLDEDFQDLEASAGMPADMLDAWGFRGLAEEVANALKDSSTWDGNNSTGFTALPSGYRNAEGEFYNPQNGYLWTTSNYGNGGQWVRHFALGYPSIYRGSFSLDRGFSVRCVKD